MIRRTHVNKYINTNIKSKRASVSQWVACLIGECLSVVSSNHINVSRCFLEQKTLFSLFIIG